jgi:hypothetical protein
MNPIRKLLLKFRRAMASISFYSETQALAPKVR